MEQNLYEKIRVMANKMRRDVLDMAFNCGGNAHLGGGLSIIDILATLYGAIMKYDVKNPLWNERDRFILSKGHGVLGFYAALHQAGYIDDNTIQTFQKNESALGAHPVMNLKIGIESSNGSLGQGLSFCVGLALGAKMRDHPYKVFTLLGNGECNEGSVWEAVMSANQYKLDNLTAIIDNNNLQSDGFSESIIDISPLENKFTAFGWNTTVVSGHDIRDLYEALTSPTKSGKPNVVIANTIKGYGIPFMENKPEWHHNRLTENLYNEALTTLGLSRW